jgi:hypothetical protein
MLMVRFRLLMVTLANGVNDQVTERIDRLQELWEVVATDLKLVLTSKIAALPEEQVAVLVPSDLNDVLLRHQHEAIFEPGGPCIRYRMGGSGPQASPSVQAFTLAAQAFLVEAEATVRAAEALRGTTGPGARLE